MINYNFNKIDKSISISDENVILSILSKFVVFVFFTLITINFLYLIFLLINSITDVVTIEGDTHVFRLKIGIVLVSILCFITFIPLIISGSYYSKRIKIEVLKKKIIIDKEYLFFIKRKKIISTENIQNLLFISDEKKYKIGITLLNKRIILKEDDIRYQLEKEIHFLSDLLQINVIKISTPHNNS
ncbi:hypothetical protein [Flammeovirga agarivorans]|uniref:Uncharacterized protein n=1 Tax=Flammeovirga agarivorans TaxID=2726742 RepID=A0A7X8SRZ3_9BACT|nr:hypothetical protein [Flammeovirga agarivorans]NLR95152.1 hypothetical protein [Flammeovirga agarivorans]